MYLEVREDADGYKLVPGNMEDRIEPSYAARPTQKLSWTSSSYPDIGIDLGKAQGPIEESSESTSAIIDEKLFRSPGHAASAHQ